MLILAYHAIADLSDDRVLAEYAVPAPLFAAQLDALARHGWSFVGPDAVLEAARGGGLPRRALLITFDDAYADLLETASQILAERGAPALAFAVTDQVGGSNAWDREKGAATLPLLDADGLRAVAARGIEIGSHTASHRALPSLPADQLDAELVGSAERIEALGLPRPRALSYPYGKWSPRLAEAVRDAGYEMAFTVEWGAVGPRSNPFALPRVEVHASDTSRKLRLKIATATWPGPVRDLVLWLLGVRLDPSGSAGRRRPGQV